MKFTADEELTVPAGTYAYQADVGAGTITLSMRIMSASAFVPITNGAITADETGIISLPTCRMKAGLTSDAEFVMDEV